MNTRLAQLLSLCLIALLGGAQPGQAMDQTVLPEVTRVSQLTALLKSRVRTVVPARLLGVVYGVDRMHSCLALADDSGWLWLETETLPAAVESGTRIAIEGSLMVGKGRAFLGKTAIIEGDYYNDSSEQSCRLYLSAGKHSLELNYHQGSQRAILETEFAGPDFPRRTIPDSVLWYADTNAPGRCLAGVQYACYRGWTASYSDFKELTPEFVGIASNFFGRFVSPDGKGGKVFVTDRTTGFPSVNYTLRFTGSLEIERAGVYQFHILADDGARLMLDYDSQYRIEMLGHTNLVTPQRLSPAQAWGEFAEPLWAEAEGTVTHVGEFKGQLVLDLRGDLGPMQVTVAEGDIAASALLLNNYVRVSGLASGTVTYDGNRIAGNLLAPSLAQVTILNVSEANWQTYIDSPIETLTRNNTTNFSKTPIHICGKVVDVVPGKSLLVRDKTGEIEVFTQTARTEDKLANVEVLGQARREGRKAVLYNAVYRRQPEKIGDQQLPLLTSIEEIRQLKDADVNIPYPVKFRGMVIHVVTGGLRGTVRGKYEGISVSSTNSQPSALRLGDLCEFEGYVDWHWNSPNVYFSSFRVLGHGQLPEPVRPTWNELWNGSVGSQWVEVQGIVLNAAPSSSTMIVGLPGGDIRVHFTQNDSLLLSQYLDAVVRVRGIATIALDQSKLIKDATIEVESPLNVTVVTPSPDNLFSQATKRVSDILVFDPNAAVFPFVKVSGQIVFARGLTYYLMDGTNGMHFTVRGTPNLVAGDVVEVVGIPENNRLSPHLKNSYARKIRHAALPEPFPVSPGKLKSDTYESTLVQFETTLLSYTTNAIDQILELQLTSTRVVLAKLDIRRGFFPKLLPQSRVRVTGVFTSVVKTSDGPPEILLNSPADVVVLSSPSWWNLRRSLTLLSFMAFALIGSFTWITALRRRVEQRTAQLRKEIAEHQRTEVNLHEKTVLLQNEVEERKRTQLEIERIHRQLVDASRQAGQAEIAVSVLHNVGNVLNSVNISASVITNRIRKLRLPTVSKFADVMEERGVGFPPNEKGKQLLDSFKQFAAHLEMEGTDLMNELRGLGQNVEHIKEIVATQQSYAKRLGFFEKIVVSELVENALKVQSAAYAHHSIHVVREFEDLPEATLDKNKVLQILVNFLQNAEHACKESGREEKTVTIRIQKSQPHGMRIEVSDNGIGIASENMTRIFTHGFTTRKDGHGFGLHSAALAAKEMGGTVTAHSNGLGQGAAFVLALPFQPVAKGLPKQPMESPA